MSLPANRVDRGYPGYDSWPHPKPPLPPEDDDEDRDVETSS